MNKPKIRLSILPFLFVSFTVLWASVSVAAPSINPMLYVLLGYKDLPDVCGSTRSPLIDVVDFNNKEKVLSSRIDEVGDMDFIGLYTPNFFTNSITLASKLNVIAVVYDDECNVVADQTGSHINSNEGYEVSFLLPPGKTYYLQIYGNSFPSDTVTGHYDVTARVSNGFSYLTGLTASASHETEYTTGTDDPYYPEVNDPEYQLDINKDYDSVTKTYYATVDPDGERTTEDAWLTLHGFIDGNGVQSSDVIAANYVNAYDLGFGRKMKCLRISNLGDDVFPCIVENHFIGPDPDNQKSPEEFASVAMELKKVNTGTISNPIYRYYTAFYVFDSQGRRINSADLDGSGPKRVPESCWSCHYGSKTSGYSRQGVYLPFDIQLFRTFPGGEYINKSSVDGMSDTELQELKENLWKLNSLVYDVYRTVHPLDTSNSTEIYTYDAVAELIEYWYNFTRPVDDSSSPSVTISSSSVFPAAIKGLRMPSGVSNPSITNHGPGFNFEIDDMTRNKHYSVSGSVAGLYGNYCRMCHVALRAKTNNAYTTSGDDCLVCHTSTAGGTPTRLLDMVCRDRFANKHMPNAKVTHVRLLENELDPETGDLRSGGFLSSIINKYSYLCTSRDLKDIQRN